MIRLPSCSLFFFFNDTATTEIYTLSLHDALPISSKTRYRASQLLGREMRHDGVEVFRYRSARDVERYRKDRKSTRLNSSHQIISYAVFCLKKKKKTKNTVICKRDSIYDTT